jgi:hypothetical protein
MSIQGDVNHNVQPVIGWLRMAIHDGTSLTTAQMEAAVEKLYETVRIVSDCNHD